jgi:hypothetical protein
MSRMDGKGLVGEAWSKLPSSVMRNWRGKGVYCGPSVCRLLRFGIVEVRMAYMYSSVTEISSRYGNVEVYLSELYALSIPVAVTTRLELAALGGPAGCCTLTSAF